MPLEHAAADSGDAGATDGMARAFHQHLDLAVLERRAAELRNTVATLERRAEELTTGVACQEAELNDNNSVVAGLTEDVIAGLDMLQDVDHAFRSLAPLAESSDAFRAVPAEALRRLNLKRRNAPSASRDGPPGGKPDWPSKDGGAGGTDGRGAAAAAV